MNPLAYRGRSYKEKWRAGVLSEKGTDQIKTVPANSREEI
jgi:hypothetical protein